MSDWKASGLERTNEKLDGGNDLQSWKRLWYRGAHGPNHSSVVEGSRYRMFGE